jgi:hypothetical protein
MVVTQDRAQTTVAPTLPPPPDAEALFKEARHRERRRRISFAVVVVVILIISAAVAASIVGLAGSNHRSPPVASKTTPRVPVAPTPATIVAWSPSFRLEVLSSHTGRLLRVLATGVAENRGLPTLSVSKVGTVYFDNAHGEGEQVLSVPVTGGTPSVVAEGRMPAVSPDGNLLAYASAGLTNEPEQILIRDLRTGAVHTWAFSTTSPDISALSWSPDSSSLSFTATLVTSATTQLTTAAIDARAPGGSLDNALPIPLPPGTVWAGYLSDRSGFALARGAGQIQLVEVSTTRARVLQRFVAIPGVPATGNAADGPEGTVQVDPSGQHFLMSTSTGLHVWTAGGNQATRLVGQVLRANWGPTASANTR